LLKPLPEDTLLHPPFDKELVALNEKFWAEAQTEFARVQRSQQIVDANEQNLMIYPHGLFGWLLMHLHAGTEPDAGALQVGRFYSRALNNWGVQQQRAGDLDAAARHFSNATNTNPDNVAATINLKFNAALRVGSNSVTLSPVTADQFGKYRGWNEVLNANGPFDETSFVFENGWGFMQARQINQAAEQFTRVRQLAPDNLAARLFLAQIYIFAKQSDRAMEALHDPLTQPGKFLLNETNSIELNTLAASVHFQKSENAQAIALMDREMDLHPEDATLLQATFQAYYMRGLYTNALNAVEHKLARFPDETQWIFNKGLVTLALKRYDDAIAAMTLVMASDTNDPIPRFNRAIAYLQSDRLPEARSDYATLQGTYTNNFQVAYGLGEIAWRTRDTNEAVRNYTLYLANAATNTAEAATVRERLAAWKR
jgi:tetratricopeptide (TPR) repeat protein